MQTERLPSYEQKSIRRGSLLSTENEYLISKSSSILILGNNYEHSEEYVTAIKEMQSIPIYIQLETILEILEEYIHKFSQKFYDSRKNLMELLENATKE